MSEVFTTMKKSAVYYRLSPFADSTPRMQRAPFSILTLPSGNYLMPMSMGWCSINPGLTSQAGDGDAETIRQWRDDFGYETDHVYVMEEQMGYIDNPSDWRGVHRFSRI